MNTTTQGERIRAARSAKGFTQAQLAEALEVSQGTVSFLENGHVRPSAATLARLSEVLDIPWSELKPETS